MFGGSGSPQHITYDYNQSMYMLILTGGHLGNILNKAHRLHHDDMYHHVSFGSAVPACFMN